ncbi:MAG: LON peptidase substrate-binding domain-containing protein [Halothiobacillus sp.]|uniref:LON peptidase substrate-binding domain-containing protein n=1 Tax=Halothiobacillus sp. TaxID=1891311 RepID=UPI002AD409B5|nr:LON peptidase substrate-binding domain-containing protein [Halothiobacillus sp.]MDA3875900.1 LON peptidase substrate-binding domain-containing protein [Halothiobacillus sp.]
MTETQTVPLFPLHTVLFPDGFLPLRIFETRYIDMVRQSLRESRPFGVVLLKQGGEVLQCETDRDTTEFNVLGTLAHIVDTDLAADGMLQIEARGDRRFRIERSWMERDGLMMGEITLLDKATVPERVADLVPRLSAFLERIMSDRDPHRANPRFDDPSWVIYRLLERLPIKLEDRQRVLTVDQLDLTVRHLSAMISALE